MSRIHNGKRIVSSISEDNKTVFPDGRKWYCTLVSHHTQKLTWTGLVKDLNITLEVIKLLKENIGGKLPDRGLGNDFVLDLMTKYNKSKNQQVGLHPTRKLLYSKGN